MVEQGSPRAIAQRRAVQAQACVYAALSDTVKAERLQAVGSFALARDKFKEAFESLRMAVNQFAYPPEEAEVMSRRINRGQRACLAALKLPEEP